MPLPDRPDSGTKGAPLTWGKSRAAFDIVPMVAVVVGDDVRACRAVIKPRIALYVATRLSALILLTGVAWSVGGYFLAEDPSAGLADAISYGVIALAATWLGVFVVFVAVKAFRVVGAL